MNVTHKIKGTDPREKRVQSSKGCETVGVMSFGRWQKPVAKDGGGSDRELTEKRRGESQISIQRSVQSCRSLGPTDPTKELRDKEGEDLQIRPTAKDAQAIAGDEEIVLIIVPERTQSLLIAEFTTPGDYEEEKQ